MNTRTTIRRIAAIAVVVPSALFGVGAIGTLAGTGVAHALDCSDPQTCNPDDPGGLGIPGPAPLPGEGGGGPAKPQMMPVTFHRQLLSPGNWAVNSFPANYGPGVSSGTFTLGGLSGASYYQDGISQQVAVPADISAGWPKVGPEKATLTFGISIATNEPAVTSDLLNADVVDNTTGTDQTFFIPSNVNATSGTVQHSFDFSQYIGHNITIRFEGLFGGPGTTTFQVSNIGLDVQQTVEVTQ